MATTRSQITQYIAELTARLTPAEARALLEPKPDRPLKPWIRPSRNASSATLNSAWRTLRRETDATAADQRALADPDTEGALAAYSANIENMAGTLKIPLGVIGPMRVNGLHAQGDYYVPLATTEAALVASYGRGAHIISLAGGAAAALLSEGVMRAPAFAFATLFEAGHFCSWVADNFERLKAAAEATTRYGKLTDISTQMEGDHVYLICRFTTGDAAGQNMATIATEALCRAIIAATPVQPSYWFLEANLSGDKKASALSFLTGRGRKVSASVLLPAELIEKQLHTSSERMHDYWRMSALGGVMSGTIGVHGHYANGLAALYLATGQDAACVAESCVGITRMEIRGPALHVSVALPSLMVGTVGGGTGLPTQSAGLRILGLVGTGKARALAEVTAALCLAGEISIIGALAAGEFGRAHKSLARDRRR